MKKVWTLFLTFLKIGALSFGGGYAMIALLENEFVELVRCCGGYRGGLYSFVYRNFLHLTVF